MGETMSQAPVCLLQVLDVLRLLCVHNPEVAPASPLLIVPSVGAARTPLSG